MKFFFLSVGLVWFASAAQAQVLPIPGGSNPDWVLEKTEPHAYSRQPGPPSGKGSPMPGIARAQTNAVDRMPNSLSKSIQSIGNRHSYWDAERQLGYEWVSRSSSLAPESLVTVREEQTGNVYTYRQKVASGAASRPRRSLGPSKR